MSPCTWWAISCASTTSISSSEYSASIVSETRSACRPRPASAAFAFFVFSRAPIRTRPAPGRRPSNTSRSVPILLAIEPVDEAFLFYLAHDAVVAHGPLSLLGGLAAKACSSWMLYPCGSIPNYRLQIPNVGFRTIWHLEFII